MQLRTEYLDSEAAPAMSEVRGLSFVGAAERMYLSLLEKAIQDHETRMPVIASRKVSGTQRFNQTGHHTGVRMIEGPFETSLSTERREACTY